MNYELLIGLKPDVVLLYGIGDAQTAVTETLKELSIHHTLFLIQGVWMLFLSLLHYGVVFIIQKQIFRVTR